MSAATEAAEERTLLGALAAGGRGREAAVMALYDRYGRRFQRHFERHGLPPAQAEELVQEVFIKILRGIDGYRSDAPPGAWLWAIARNTLISHHRQAPPEHLGDEEIELETLLSVEAHDPETEELIECIRARFLAFAERHRERADALALLAFHGWKPAELAAHLQRTAAATREYLSQCRKLLRPFLVPCHELMTA